MSNDIPTNTPATIQSSIKSLSREVELVSAFYAERHAIDRSSDWLMLKLNEEVGELTQAYLARSGQSRSKGRAIDEMESDFRSELADVFVQVLLLAERFEIDLYREVDRKWFPWKPVRET